LEILPSPSDSLLAQYPDLDIEAAGRSCFETSSRAQDTRQSSVFHQGMVQDPLDSTDHGPDLPVSLTRQDTFLAQLSSESSEPNANGSPLLLNSTQIEPAPASPFAIYAINNPGLSALCAKINLFNSIIGPGFSLDIWDPTALSPICLGVTTRPCPANFQPTPLQRSVPHHPVIDLFPWPLFRDRFLYTMSLPKELRPRIAQDDMPRVTVEVMAAAKDAIGGIRVWGSNAFLAENWEVGQTFYSKFWWAIDASIIRSSNQHRARRGEGQLQIKLIDVIE
jgi:hypothetical protein